MTPTDILAALVTKRAQMVSNETFTLGNVYGMNEAVDLVARAIGTHDPEPYTLETK